MDVPLPALRGGPLPEEPAPHEPGAVGVFRLRRGRHHHRRGPGYSGIGGKIYTQIKIDEITNLGAVKIRMRSLFAALTRNKRDYLPDSIIKRRRTALKETIMAKLEYDKTGRLLFTKEMKKEYTILFPMMAPIHFNIIKGCVYPLRLQGGAAGDHWPANRPDGIKVCT